MPKTGANRWSKTAGGMSKEPFYEVYHSIRARCEYPTDKDFKNYGGRGIRFCWDNYVDFKKDMYKSYLDHKAKNKSTTIERLNVNGHYEKINCIWVTIQDQQKNKRSNRYITYDGITLTIADWARKLNVSRQAVRYRLDQNWDVKSIITMPFNHGNKYNK